MIFLFFSLSNSLDRLQITLSVYSTHTYTLWTLGTELLFLIVFYFINSFSDSFLLKLTQKNTEPNFLSHFPDFDCIVDFIFSFWSLKKRYWFTTFFYVFHSLKYWSRYFLVWLRRHNIFYALMRLLLLSISSLLVYHLFLKVKPIHQRRRAKLNWLTGCWTPRFYIPTNCV